MGECNKGVCGGVGCPCSHLTTVEKLREQPIVHLVRHNYFLICPLHPLSLLLVMCFMCPNPTPGLALHRTASAQIGSTAPPHATLAPQIALVVYIISVCCVAR